MKLLICNIVWKFLRFTNPYKVNTIFLTYLILYLVSLYAFRFMPEDTIILNRNFSGWYKNIKFHSIFKDFFITIHSIRIYFFNIEKYSLLSK